MQFLKRHYEKIILSVVLLGLAAVAAGLPIKVNQEKEREEQRKQQLIGAAVKPFPPVDLSTNKTVLEKVKNPIHFDIAGKHNLFNPVPWMQRPNGELVKVKTGREVGIGALELTAITPLQMIVTYDGVVSTDPKDPKYQITVIRETDRSPKNSRAFAKGAANQLGTLKDVRGPDENPTEVVFVPAGEQEPVVISKEKPFTKVIGYAANFTAPGLVRTNARKGDPVLLQGVNGVEAYNISSIEKDAVVFSAKSNRKPTIKRLNSSEASSK